MAGARAAAQRVVLPKINAARFLTHLLLDLKYWVQQVRMMARKVDESILCDAVARFCDHLINIQLQAQMRSFKKTNSEACCFRKE